HEGDHLAQASQRAGFDLAKLDAEIEEKADHYDAIINENQARLEKAGHWGVPTLVFQDEPFFGQDRLDIFIWRLQQHGLTERDS
ncbi:MAG: DsbA family protein, partial [Pseudomonadota bacterium]